jgi:hypothetical protein
MSEEMEPVNAVLTLLNGHRPYIVRDHDRFQVEDYVANNQKVKTLRNAYLRDVA